MSIEYKVIGRNIRAARKQRNMTQEAVAEAIDMSPQHFGKVERGDRKINLQRLSELSVLLDVTLESLVTGCVVADNHAHMPSGHIEGIEEFWRASKCCLRDAPKRHCASCFVYAAILPMKIKREIRTDARSIERVFAFYRHLIFKNKYSSKASRAPPSKRKNAEIVSQKAV